MASFSRFSLSCIIAGMIAFLACESVKGQGYRFEYARNRVNPVIQLGYAGGMIANPDRTPFLRIYGDGTVVVHYPKYTRKAGEYEMKLTDDELNSLLSSLAKKGLMTFDAEKVKEEKRKELKRRQEEARKTGKMAVTAAIMDAATTVVEIKLDSFTPADKPAGTVRNLNKKISWYAVEFDARQFPQVRSLVNLAAAVKELRALANSNALQKRN